jgi:hypothetical protein
VSEIGDADPRRGILIGLCRFPVGVPAKCPTARSVSNSGLDNAGQCSIFVLMEVETLGVARSLGWKVHMRCADGYRESTRSMRRCVYRKQLDLETLVSTRGPNFPLSRLESRLMCPACGNRRVTVVFEPPSNAQASSR